MTAYYLTVIATMLTFSYHFYSLQKVASSSLKKSGFISLIAAEKEHILVFHKTPMLLY